MKRAQGHSLHHYLYHVHFQLLTDLGSRHIDCMQFGHNCWMIITDECRYSFRPVWSQSSGMRHRLPSVSYLMSFIMPFEWMRPIELYMTTIPKIPLKYVWRLKKTLQFITCCTAFIKGTFTLQLRFDMDGWFEIIYFFLCSNKCKENILGGWA